MITLLTAVNCTSGAIISTWGTEYFGVNRTEFMASQTILMMTIAFTPMLLAPVSEAVSVLHLFAQSPDELRWVETRYIKSHQSCMSIE